MYQNSFARCFAQPSKEIKEGGDPIVQKNISLSDDVTALNWALGNTSTSATLQLLLLENVDVNIKNYDMKMAIHIRLTRLLQSILI